MPLPHQQTRISHCILTSRQSCIWTEVLVPCRAEPGTHLTALTRPVYLLSLHSRAETELTHLRLVQFERTLIVAEDGAYVSYLEGCTAPSYDKNQVLPARLLAGGLLFLFNRFLQHSSPALSHLPSGVDVVAIPT